MICILAKVYNSKYLLVNPYMYNEYISYNLPYYVHNKLERNLFNQHSLEEAVPTFFACGRFISFQMSHLLSQSWSEIVFYVYSYRLMTFIF